MPPSQQNALVQKYCTVCHTDAAKNGGLSLQHFDAAHAAPSLAAMMLSKLSGGTLLAIVRNADADPAAVALLNGKMKSGAMSAAGIPIPDKTTIDSLVHAFAAESRGAEEWTIERPKLTASILREMPSAGNTGGAESYRLIVSCNSVTREGYVQLAWSPLGRAGTLDASVDGSPARHYRVEGSEAMGNGSGLILHGPAALLLAEAKPGMPETAWPFPNESLTIGNLFPDETVKFSFTKLPKDARQEFRACFPDISSSTR